MASLSHPLPHHHHHHHAPERRQRLSLEIRTRLVQAVNEQQLSIAEAARRLMVPENSACSFLKHYNDTGKIEPKKTGGNRQPVLTEEHLDWIQAQIDKKANVRVSDLHNDIQKAFQFNTKPPSCSAIDEAIKTKLHYTLKLLKVEPADYNSPERIAARAQWARSFSNSGASMFNCVYIDESGFNLHQHVSYGRAKQGQCAIRIAPSD